jgi:hypothetical protein
MTLETHIRRTWEQLRNLSLTVALVGLAATKPAVADTSVQSYISTPAISRHTVFGYCRMLCKRDMAKSDCPYRTIFEKALAGDRLALEKLFADATYHTNDDIEWDIIPWHILHVMGDEQYSRFVLTHPVTERGPYLALQYPYIVGVREHAAFERYFRHKFPRTYSLWVH